MVSCFLLSACTAPVVDSADPYGRALPVTRNFLKESYKEQYQLAFLKSLQTPFAAEKAYFIQKYAAALDSLGRSDEALEAIDKGLAMVEGAGKEKLLISKGLILFSLNDPNGALSILRPIIDTQREVAKSAKLGVVLHLSEYSNAFVAAVFAHMQLEQWKDAIDVLSDTYAFSEGPGFFSYQSLLYRYIMARADTPALANPMLEMRAKKGAEIEKSHYGDLLRMWQGADNEREVNKRYMGLKPSAAQQDVLAEILFYRSAYQRFVKKDVALSKVIFDRLNRLEPYGSIEWIYGKRVLQ